MLQGGTAASGTGDPVINYYEIYHGNPSVSPDNFTRTLVKDGTTIGGTASESDSNYNISGVEWSGSNTVPGGWADCTPTDGAFDSTSEGFTCNFSSLEDGPNKRIYIRTHDQNDVYMPSRLYASTNLFEMDTREGSSTSTPENETTYQIPFSSSLRTNESRSVLIPSKDSDPESKGVTVIIEPATLSFNSFLSSNKDNDLYEIWYKAYPPVGANTGPAKIIPELQKKPSILALPIPNKYSNDRNIKISHSLDNKSWKILPGSVVDPVNKTIATITKIGGYYRVVLIEGGGKVTAASIQGVITIVPSPLPTQTTGPQLHPKKFNVLLIVLEKIRDFLARLKK